jgi:FkbM family methyltransferase
VAALAEVIRDRFHPLHHARSVPLVGGTLGLCDIELWARVPGVASRMRVRLVRHASYLLLSRGVEPTIVAFMRAACDVLKPRLCWDVGANFGYYSFLLKTLRPNARVVMFEPDPDNVRLVQRTLADAQIDGIELLPVAASDSSRKAIFHADPVAGATGTLEGETASFSQRHWGHSRPVPVRAVALDDLLPESDGLDLVKIDVEGHEEHVVRGASRTLARHRPIVVFECFHGGDEIAGELETIGYLLLDADRRRAPTACSTNFVAIPSRYLDRHEALMDSWRAASATPPKLGRRP